MDSFSKESAPRRRRARRGHGGHAGLDIVPIMLLLLMIIAPSVQAVFINFANCLDDSIIQSNPQRLQFVPMFFYAKYDPSDGPFPLNITVYGNVAGSTTKQAYPAPDDPGWANPNVTLGKIINATSTWITTLVLNLDMLSFTPASSTTGFCATLTQGTCPLGPVFNVNMSNPAELRAFHINQNLQSSYRFSSIASLLRVKSTDENSLVACISATITPDLGSTFRGLLSMIPLFILVLVGFATVFAAVQSPWGTADPFRWTSNYGRDEDLLRLVTPGFADCLQYIQFIVLTGALSLNYPGYYQPAVSQAGWSVLMFNHSFVSKGGGINPVVDGIYAVNTTYGLDGLSQLVGMAGVQDVWPGMAVWLLIILGSVTILTQLAFFFRWIYRVVARVSEEDHRAKNLPFTIGNVVRIVFNYLLLPIISLSMFQLVVAGKSPAVSNALAVVLILALIAFSIWLIRLIATTRPKSYLFDDLPTVLLYGPLYNTYCDDAAAFALVSILITFLRGVAIGAVQPSGIAQLVLLAICEVVFSLTLSAFRPFPSTTSMNFYHFCFSIVRFVVVLLSVTFVPSLGVSEQAKGWIGYIILIIHAIVLVFGFFLNSLRTIIEVVARLAGAGGNGTSATRGGLSKVFGMRQLSRRVARADPTARQSMNSEAAMLANVEDRSTQYDEQRPRSLSGSSAMLLNRAGASDGRTSGAFDNGSAHGGSHSRTNSSGLYTPTTPATSTAFSQGAVYQAITSGSHKSGSVVAFKQSQSEPDDPYFRPPRPRRMTLEARSSTDITRAKSGPLLDPEGDGMEIRSGTPVPAYLGTAREEPEIDEPRGPTARKDYAVREVDFYYRVRGPALSHMGTRKLKTGPADPTSPVSSATGWFRRLLGGKTKETGKGFEVVRSTRAPPPGLFPSTGGEHFHEPYRDDPDGQVSDDAGNSPATGGHSRQLSGTMPPYQDSDGDDNLHAGRTGHATMLPPIDSGGDIELPSRLGSRSGSHEPVATPTPPPIPRKSSRRQSSVSSQDDVLHRSLVLPGPPPVDAAGSYQTPFPDSPGPTLLQPSDAHTGRLPFSHRPSSGKDRAGSTGSTASSFQHGSSVDHTSDTLTIHDRTSSVGYVAQHRAGANIRQTSPSDVPLTGSTAELVEAAPSDSD
ncbi:Transient receptor potential (TRP) ion channel domain containing protein [Elaphomyces granulatus]